MSMQIKFEDDYNEATHYFGTVIEPESTIRGEYNFVVEVVYFSQQGSWIIASIEWVDEPKDKDKAEDRITKLVMDWHKERYIPKQNFITAQDPGDKNE